MTPGKPNAVDMSNHGGALTADEVRAMANAGIDTVIVGTGPGWYGLQSRQQAESAQAGGMRVEAYTYMEFTSDPEGWVDAALASVGDTPVRRWWLDVEDTRATITPQERIALTRRALARFQHHGIFAGIYTGGWYWRPYMANTDAFAKEGRPLWNSYYDGDPDIDGLPYGGWTEADVAIEQFTGTTTIGGQSVDSNYIYDYGEGSLSAKDIERIDRLERVLAGHAGIVVTPTDGNVGALAKATGRTIAPGSGDVTLSQEEALAFLDAQGMNFTRGLQNTQESVGNVIRVVESLSVGSRLTVTELGQLLEAAGKKLQEG